MTYSEKLNDPRWQAKRKEILERDKNKCTICKSRDKVLQVHHLAYISGLQPWEYSGDFLKTLCIDCHKAEEDFKIKTQHLLAELSYNGVPFKEIFQHILTMQNA